MALPLTELHDNDKINSLSDELKIDRKNRQEILTQVLREKRLLAKEKELDEKEKSLNKKNAFVRIVGSGWSKIRAITEPHPKS